MAIHQHSNKLSVDIPAKQPIDYRVSDFELEMNMRQGKNVHELWLAAV
jgi:hypothetical protein